MKSNVKIIISIALVLVGLIGILVCVIPSASSEYKIVKKYISAVNGCNEKAIKACTAVDQYSQIFEIDTADSDFEFDGDATKYDYLKASSLSIKNSVPEDAKEVKKVSLISCKKTTDAAVDLFSSSFTEVDAVVRVTYKTEDDKTVSVTNSQNFTLSKTSKGYKIVG